MKKSELKRLIKEAIYDVLNEDESLFQTWDIDEFSNKSLAEADFEDAKTSKADYAKYVDARLNPEKESGKATAAKLGRLMHKSNIVDENGNVIDEKELVKKIMVRPTEIINTNSKLKKSNNKIFKFYDTTLPAFQGFYVDEGTGELRVIRTCPAAGACAKFCYATKGGYIQYKHSSIGSSRLVNYLVNDKEGFKRQLTSEIKAEADKLSSKGITVVLRWHDSGDFFSKDYLDMAYDIAKATPNVIHYAYTKALKLVKGTEKPKNFVFNFSAGGIHDKEIDKTKDKFSEVVPKEMFIDLFQTDEKGRHAKDKKGFKVFVPGGKDELKRRIAQGYKIPIQSIITWSELMNMPYNPNVDIKPKYNVLVSPGDGDNSAMRKDVLGTYLLIH